MPMPGDQTTTEKGPTGEQGRGPSAERTQGGGTGGGDSAPAAAPQPTAEAPKPETGAGVGSHRTASPDGARAWAPASSPAARSRPTRASPAWAGSARRAPARARTRRRGSRAPSRAPQPVGMWR
jgi:hypothetical protein